MDGMIRSGDGRSVAKVVGSGDATLLCLHGWGDSGEVFRRLAPELSRASRLVIVDWRGHGAAGPAAGDFAADDLVQDALDLLDRIGGAGPVIPVAVSHAGWMALELCRRLRERVRGLVLIDWMVLGAPPQFVAGLRELAVPEQSAWVREALFRMWLNDQDVPEVEQHLREVMSVSPLELWRIAAREILGAYARWMSPLTALAGFDPPLRTLHVTSLCAPEGLVGERQFARENPWFEVEAVPARTHFPTLECPDAVTRAVSRFVRTVSSSGEARATGT